MEPNYHLCRAKILNVDLFAVSSQFEKTLDMPTSSAFIGIHRYVEPIELTVKQEEGAPSWGAR